MFQVSVSPDMGMYNLLRRQGYEPANALAEFVDNALHAFQEFCPQRVRKGPPLSIKLHIYSAQYPDKSLRETIVIEDNGSGITRTRLIDAFKPAKQVSKIGLSEFGIGMKAAAVWFTETWSLTTRPVGEKTKFEFKFDLGELIKAGRDVVDVAESAAEGFPEGTKIVLSNVRRAINRERFDDICADLVEIYQRFTEGSSAILDLTAYYDGTPVDLKFKPPVRETLRAPEFKSANDKTYAIGKEKDWLVPVSLVFGGALVEGHVRLLTKGSYTNNPGLVLFRHDRVIQGTSRQPFIPIRLLSTANKYGRQRVYGELHMGELPVSYTKDKFEIDEDQFVDALRRVSGMEDLLRQATEYRKVDRVIPVTSFKALEKLIGKKASRAAKTAGASTVEKGADKDSKRRSTPKVAAPPAPPYVAILGAINGKSSSLVLNSVIEETIQQFIQHRGIAAALCLRIVVEVGVLHKIKKDFPAQYTKVSEKSIAALLRYMNSNRSDFFDTSRDHLVVKCIESAINSTQAEAIMLNNIAHGHWHPEVSELNTLVKNLQQLLHWAYL